MISKPASPAQADETTITGGACKPNIKYNHHASCFATI